MENQPRPTGDCWCGCGGKTGRGSYFLPGHDRIAEAAVVNSEYGSVARLLEAHGYGPGGKNPTLHSEDDDAEGGRDEWQEMEEGLGFKRLTPENWLESDSVMRAFTHGAISGEPYVPSGEERVRDAMNIELTGNVPLQVRRLFAVARGALCYGYFFYPLYALASEQLLRVAEAAIARKYEAVEGPSRARGFRGRKAKKPSFRDKLDYLAREGFLSANDVIWWGAIREQRNSASHPHDHRPEDPGSAIGRAETLATKVNRLFEV